MQKIFFIFIICIGFIACQNGDKDRKEKNTHIGTTVEDTVVATKQLEQKKELDILDKPYNPEADAAHDLAVLIDSARKVDKNIIIQAGGNWCIWCLRFEKFRKESDTISKIINDHYLYYHLNYSEENKNEAILKSLGDPGKLGYPVFIILNKEGKQIYTQGSEHLEDGNKSYDENKVVAFLNQFRKA